MNTTYPNDIVTLLETGQIQACEHCHWIHEGPCKSEELAEQWAE